MERTQTTKCCPELTPYHCNTTCYWISNIWMHVSVSKSFSVWCGMVWRGLQHTGHIYHINKHWREYLGEDFKRPLSLVSGPTSRDTGLGCKSCRLQNSSQLYLHSCASVCACVCKHVCMHTAATVSPLFLHCHHNYSEVGWLLYNSVNLRTTVAEYQLQVWPPTPHGSQLEARLIGSPTNKQIRVCIRLTHPSPHLPLKTKTSCRSIDNNSKPRNSETGLPSRKRQSRVENSKVVTSFFFSSPEG